MKFQQRGGRGMKWKRLGSGYILTRKNKILAIVGRVDSGWTWSMVLNCPVSGTTHLLCDAKAECERRIK